MNITKSIKHINEVLDKVAPEGTPEREEINNYCDTLGFGFRALARDYSKYYKCVGKMCPDQGLHGECIVCIMEEYLDKAEEEKNYGFE